LVITAVVLEGRSQADVARAYGVSKGWVSKLVARYRIDGDAAFDPRSRRPKTSPTRTPDAVTALIVETRHRLHGTGLDAGADTIAWHLRHHHGHTVSRSTVRRILIAAGLITPEPRKRPRSSYTRFEATLPNECWQADFTHYRLADNRDIEILCWIDDHSRYALSVTAHHRVTGRTVVDTFRTATHQHGLPASTLTDNGLVFTTRFARGGNDGRNAFETELAHHGITQKNSRPNHPTTCGKVERFHQTLKRFLDAHPAPRTITELQQHLDTFTTTYNHHRPHRSLPHRATPATAYTTRPKATPDDRTHNAHYRVRKDRIDDAGKVTLRHQTTLHKIAVGRRWARQPIVMLVNDLDIRIIHATTGEVLRTLTLDPNRRYQPLTPTPQQQTTEP
jgi:transposase InsO family protein